MKGRKGRFDSLQATSDSVDLLRFKRACPAYVLQADILDQHQMA